MLNIKLLTVNERVCFNFLNNLILFERAVLHLILMNGQVAQGRKCDVMSREWTNRIKEFELVCGGRDTATQTTAVTPGP